MGVTGRERAAYQARTDPSLEEELPSMGGHLPHYSPLWPNFAVLELAPTTAKDGEEKKMRADASVLILMLMPGWQGGGSRVMGRRMELSVAEAAWDIDRGSRGLTVR
jgi:hypothetical protein